MNRKTASLGSLTAFLVLLGYGSGVCAQQYIAEQILEESLKRQQEEKAKKPQPVKEIPTKGEKDSMMLDPRVTPEYWGIKAATII